MATTAVDPHALQVAAQRLDAAADILSIELATHLRGLHCHAALRGALDQLVADVAQWELAARALAAALRTGAQRYTENEAHATEVLR